MKKILAVTLFSIFLLLNAATAFAIGEGGACHPNDALRNHGCDGGLFCKPIPNDPNNWGSCEKDEVQGLFGKIQPPDALRGFLDRDPTGASAISDFLSRLVILIFSIATIVLIFMVLWGAFEWLTSGGDKEKLSSAQKRIIHALIGIVLFSVAFAIIRILGKFTGFTFF